MLKVCWHSNDKRKPIEKMLKEKSMIFCDNLVLKTQKDFMLWNVTYQWNNTIEIHLFSHLGWTQSKE
jgi:hypothetical protein